MADRPESDLRLSGAPEDEIEITPEMIEAGVEAFAWDERFEPLEAAIERAYLAMRSLSFLAMKEKK